MKRDLNIPQHKGIFISTRIGKFPFIFKSSRYSAVETAAKRKTKKK